MTLEAFLARLYTDPALRAAFLDRPREVARMHGVAAQDAEALARIDRDGLQLAAESFARKRAKQG